MDYIMATANLRAHMYGIKGEALSFNIKVFIGTGDRGFSQYIF